MANTEPVAPQLVDSFDMKGQCGFCTPVEMNLIIKVLSIYKDLKLWLSPKTIDYNCDTRVMSC